MKLWFERGAWASRKGREKVARMMPEDVRSVAVIRHAAIGDMIHTRPMLRELRRFFPNASITLSLVSNYTYGAPTDLADRVHVAIGSDRREASLREQIAVGKELGYHDILFDVSATSRSFWLCLLNRAGLKIGFPYHAIQRPIYYDLAVHRPDFQFEGETMLDMLRLLGHKPQARLDYALDVTPHAPARPYMVYFTSASTPTRCWPEERFAELLRHMTAAYPGHDHVVLEGVGKDESITTLLERVPGIANLQGRKAGSLDDTLALLKGAELLISNDTGVMNLGMAVEAPTLGIFFNSVPFRIWRRDNGRHDAVFRPDGALPEVADVVRAVDAMLSRGQGH